MIVPSPVQHAWSEHVKDCHQNDLRFPKIGGTPKSSIFTGFSLINHPSWVLRYPKISTFSPPYDLNFRCFACHFLGQTCSFELPRSWDFLGSFGFGGLFPTCWGPARINKEPETTALSDLPTYHPLMENLPKWPGLLKNLWEQINGFVWKCWVNIPNEIAI